MAHANKTLWWLLPYLEKLPEQTFFDNTLTHVDFQAHTQKDVARIKAVFPTAIWKRTRKEGDCKWWEYSATIEGHPIRIYGVYEAPPWCKAIVETQTVTEQIPTAWETKDVTKEVIVGWDCGGGGVHHMEDGHGIG